MRVICHLFGLFSFCPPRFLSLSLPLLCNSMNASHIAEERTEQIFRDEKCSAAPIQPLRRAFSSRSSGVSLSHFSFFDWSIGVRGFDQSMVSYLPITETDTTQNPLMIDDARNHTFLLDTSSSFSLCDPDASLPPSCEHA